MNRIQEKFNELKRKKEKALIVFMTAGDPSLKKNEQMVAAFEKEGVDLIEFGVPFSDPLADGPVIQASSQRSLHRKTNLSQILKLVERVRRRSEIPVVLMSYLNPLLSFGLEKFSRAAKKAGVDGVIIPDLPADESAEILPAMRRQKLDVIFLLAPTSTPQRQHLIARVSRGFIYYVSLTGVTGIRKQLPDSIDKNIQSMRRHTRLPICAGFGISTPEQVRSVCKSADGVIIGSVIVKALAENAHMDANKFAAKFVRPFAKALGGHVNHLTCPPRH